MSTVLYPFSNIVIIYNPNSTGDSVKNAKILQKRLVRTLPKSVTVKMLGTTHAGHAEKLAKVAVKNQSFTLVVSSSGDGGFNEVLNGVLGAKNPNAAALVLPSGNANDHHEATSQRSVQEKILDPQITLVDAIKVTGMKDGKKFERYAHSYVGVGLTAYIGKRLTETDLNPVNEKWLVLKYLFLFKSVTLKVEPSLRWYHYASIVFSTVDRMSKVIKLAQDSDHRDGKMEVYELRTSSTIKTIMSLVFGSTLGLRPTARLKQQSFMARRPVQVQLDGEVMRLDANRKVSVSAAHKIFKTVQ